MTENANQQPPQTFYAKVGSHSQNFAQFLLQEVPELEAVAVVLSYKHGNVAANNDIPYAVVSGQTGPLRDASEIMQLANQLWRTLNYQLQQAQTCIRLVDDYMKEQAANLKQLQDQIHAAKTQCEPTTGP